MTATTAPTRFVAAYDVERADCLDAMRTIVAIHREMGVPATCFFLGEHLQAFAAAYRELVGDSKLFEVASHSYHHDLLRFDRDVKCRLTAAERVEQLRRSKALVEETFGRPCLGLRPPSGFPQGLHGARRLVDDVAGIGFRYVSSRLWGPDFTLPAPVRPPETYEAEGHPELRELPAHGWHDNALKGNEGTPGLDRLRRRSLPQGVAWPVARSADEAVVNCALVDEAVGLGRPYVSPIWHPWSLRQGDLSMAMLRATFQHVRVGGLAFGSFEQEYLRLDD